MKKSKNLDITNRKSIQNMIDYLENYKKEIENQCRTFCERLADVGIKVATISSLDSGALGAYVVFAKELNGTSSQKGECAMLMYGRDITSIIGEDENAAEVSPILMVEYGSGMYAVSEKLVEDILVGRGTFPGQTHAFDPDGWWYKSTKDGQWHHSYGIKPSYPMQKAYDKMQTQVDKIARSTFRLP